MHLSEFSATSAQASTALGGDWFATVRASVDPVLLATIDAFSDPAPGAPMQLWSQLVPLAYDTPAPHDVPAFLTYVTTLAPLQLRLALLGYHSLPPERVAPQELLFLAAQGDEAALRDVAVLHFPDDPVRSAALYDLLAVEPDETRARLVAIMRRWYDEVFREHESQIVPILERDAHATRTLGRTLAVAELVETVTNGIEFQPWPGLASVALVPTYVMRPWTVRLFEAERAIFCYPASDDSLVEDAHGSTAPPARLVRLHQALGDERRMRILRHLATERATLQEIATALNLPKSSLHYHLGILRSAGLLRVGTVPRGTAYSLRREALSGMDDALLHYFDGE